MRIRQISEPQLAFGQNNHVCPRAGIMKYGVYDTNMTIRPSRIVVGAVGSSQNLNELNTWLERCRGFIPPQEDSEQPNLRAEFCGFNNNIGFRAELVFGEEVSRFIRNRDLQEVIKLQDWNRRVNQAVELYFRQIKFLAQNRPVDVIVCVIPDELYDLVSKMQLPSIEESIEDDQTDDLYEVNFRRLLKARTMHLGKPLQLVRQKSLQKNPRGMQDDATRAWNFTTALYYKANQATVPWKLISNINRPSICYVGIGFYRSRNRQTLNTSLAQVFDELGNSVILRGTPIDTDKDDRRPHLKAEQAEQLLSQALNEYEIALDTSPGRVVLHKSSNYNEAELEGFRAATDAMRVNSVDFVTLLDADMRLLRHGNYPPYRGMHVELDQANHLLYTRGFVPYYETYTGKYIPEPLEVRIAEADESPDNICDEILSLTKMNWNNTQFDGKYPITLVCARRVGQIMKYLGDDERPQINYSFYM
ncbi:MAG: hypothetical protein K8L99_30110 [Anaerolineae bacterium]|nr:hypothetical protein [Anaerolineae bacterium]